MGFSVFWKSLSRPNFKLHSWLILLFILHGNYFCIVVSTVIRAEGETTSQSTEINSSTSTVRPWPSHEFLQDVIKTAKTVTQSTPTPGYNVSHTKNSSFYNSSPSTTASAAVKPPQYQRGANATLREITIVADFGAVNNDPDAKKTKQEIVKEIRDDMKQEIANFSSNIKTSKVMLRDHTNNYTYEFLNTTTRPTTSSRILERDYLFESKSNVGFKVNSGESAVNVSVPTGKGNQGFILIQPAENRSLLEEIEPRWINILSSSNKNTNVRQSISTTGELPFRVTAAKKKTTNFTQGFYDQLLVGSTHHDQQSNNHQGNVWGLKSKPFRADLSHKNHDYVTDDHIGWAAEDDQGTYSNFPSKAPELTLLKYSFKGQVPKKNSHTQFPIITATSIVPFMEAPATTTTPNPASVFPIITQSSVKPFIVANLGPNKISSFHWGSSGTKANFDQQPTPSTSSSVIITSNSPGVSVVPVLKAPPTTTIKFTADLTSTDPINSGTSLLSQVFLTSADKFPLLATPTVLPSPSKTIKTVRTSTTTAPVSKIGSTLAPKSPAHIWYKPVINHHYAVGPIGGGGPQASGSSGVGRPPGMSGMVPQAPTPVDHFPMNSGSTTDDSEEDDRMDRPANKIVSPTERNIHFKIWNYVNGSVELKNEKIIPMWIFKDYNISNDKVLNINDLPRAHRRIIKNQITELNVGPGDRRWQQLPMLEMENDGMHLIRPHIYNTRKPISLNYVLWNEPPRASQPHDFLLDAYDNEGYNSQMNNYLQYLVDKNNQDSNWNKIQNYLKKPTGAIKPPFFDLHKTPTPSLFPNFEDKDISNLVAVSLIMSYLNKDKDFHPSISDFTSTTSSLENLSMLFSTVKPTRTTTTKPTTTPAHHLSAFFNPQTASNFNENLSYLYTTTTTPAPVSDEDKMWESIKPVLTQFLRRHKTQRVPSTVIPRHSTTPTMTFSSNTNRFHLDINDTLKQLATTVEPEIAEKGDLGEAFNDEIQRHPKFGKKKLGKKRLKKFKKKKGWEHFGFDFNLDLDFSHMIKKKIYSLLALKYAPILVLFAVMLAPFLMLWVPYMKRGWGWGWGNDDIDHYTYVYPYTYAYPVNGKDQHQRDPYDTGNNYGWKGIPRSKDKGLEVHHHYLDVPLPSSVGYSDEGAGDYSGDYVPDTKGSYADGAQQKPVSVLGLANYLTTQAPLLAPATVPDLSYLAQLFPTSSTPAPLVDDNMAESYMNRIRQIGRNLGMVIGSQINDAGNQEAMQVIMDNKRDTINQLIQRWLSLKDSPFVPKYRSSNGDGTIYRRSPKFRKRKKRSQLL